MGRSRLARLGTTASFIGRRLAARTPAQPGGQVASAMATLPSELARATAVVAVPAGADWVDTGLVLTAGDRVTLIGEGRLWLAKALGVGVGANTALWHKVGEGPIAKSLGNTTSFTADAPGRLFLVAKPPGEWLDETGRFDPDQPRSRMTGALTVGVVVWRRAKGLEAAAAAAPSSLFAREVERQAGWVEPPGDWRPLWRLGHGPIYREAMVGDRPVIACRTHGDVGILRREVDLPLNDVTRLAWSWRVGALPSTLPEDIQPTHDYLSIAVEFENGRDLTYMWSRALPAGTSFQCPLPWWCERETHLVVRSGEADLGRWLDEDRPLLADYRVAIGGPEPSRVVAVWLIAVSVFQGGTGICDYAGIRLLGEGEALDLL